MLRGGTGKSGPLAGTPEREVERAADTPAWPLPAVVAARAPLLPCEWPCPPKISLLSPSKDMTEDRPLRRPDGSDPAGPPAVSAASPPVAVTAEGGRGGSGGRGGRNRREGPAATACAMSTYAVAAGGETPGPTMPAKCRRDPSPAPNGTGPRPPARMPPGGGANGGATGGAPMEAAANRRDLDAGGKSLDAGSPPTDASGGRPPSRSVATRLPAEAAPCSAVRPVAPPTLVKTDA
ncbi:hypothetical protein BU14_0056s0027 [Porphyra umbilicalis]|uniref:Uncharacterized protein n=1 Tax=Porphyra umbilicalis TaxID=2786 RepID=A0A1X6PH87_PORUM|nr:hypothetical protein BU14_0056s0027 [Porphyra umbilicalis]|eukprot:OSX80244.1 hypothetical protein BU14_0056s0027 [Porphyra umbilicalis]